MMIDQKKRKKQIETKTLKNSNQLNVWVIHHGKIKPRYWEKEEIKTLLIDQTSPVLFYKAKQLKFICKIFDTILWHDFNSKKYSPNI